MDVINDEKLIFWQKLIEEQKKSGLLIKDFCKGKNIGTGKYYYYYGMLNKLKMDSPKKLNASSKPIPNNLTRPINIVNTPPKENVIRFILPNNLQCVLPRDMSLSEIKSILQLVISC
jgi:hypothetical protein